MDSAMVHQRGSLFHQCERVDEGQRHALGPDAEVLERALRLRAPEPIGFDLDRTEGVGLGAARGAVGGRHPGLFCCARGVLT